jgi:predicted HTH transcriptional regulator
MVTIDPRALLRRLLQEPTETTWLEFKHNNCNPEEIGRCLSACANAAILAERDRAYVVFGIENVTKRKLGTAVRLKSTKKGNENLSNWLSRMMTPPLMMEFLDFEEGGKQFAILAIEPTYDRPVRFGGAEFIRIGENVKPLKDFQEHERALWLATGKRKFESAIALPHQTSEQVLDKLDTDVYYAMSQQPKPANTDEIIRKMEAVGFIKEDMEGTYDVTNLGAIVLARDIGHFPSIASKSVRVTKYVGKDKQKSEMEIEGRKGYAVGFSGLMQFIMNRLPTNEVYHRGVRKNLPVYPETAVREIIANALIHQDFTVSGVGPVIEIYDDRIEVSNPGNSLVAVDRIIDERRSRNEKLAGTMRTLGLCEERGGGIDKAILQIEEMSLPAPLFFLSENSMRVVLFGPKKFGDLSKADKTWACFCHCVVRFNRHDYMSNATLRKRFSLPETEYQAVSAVIANARKEGRIVPADENQGNKYAKYVPYWAR